MSFCRNCAEHHRKESRMEIRLRAQDRRIRELETQLASRIERVKYLEATRAPADEELTLP